MIIFSLFVDLLKMNRSLTNTKFSFNNLTAFIPSCNSDLLIIKSVVSLSNLKLMLLAKLFLWIKIKKGLFLILSNVFWLVLTLINTFPSIAKLLTDKLTPSIVGFPNNWLYVVLLCKNFKLYSSFIVVNKSNFPNPSWFVAKVVIVSFLLFITSILLIFIPFPVQFFKLTPTVLSIFYKNKPLSKACLIIMSELKLLFPDNLSFELMIFIFKSVDSSSKKLFM